MNLPGPVLAAGAALCLLAGYLLGVVAGPDTPARTTGVVESYDTGTGHLCLSGDAAGDIEGAQDGRLCGLWRRSAGSSTPEPGDDFRFVAVKTSQVPEGHADAGNARVLIFGDVVD